MIHLYKKVDKTKSNPLGSIEITSYDDLTKPFLLCLSAQNNYYKSVYGIIREGVQAARFYSTVEDAGLYKLTDSPVDFLGLSFQSDDDYHDSYVEIAEKLLYPFLINNGDDPENMALQARKMNIFTYCDGTLTYKNAELHLKKLLLNRGYSKDIVVKILSQISLVAIGTMVDVDDIKATGVVFVDVNDEEISNRFTRSYRELLNNNSTQFLYTPIQNCNSIFCVYQGSGRHSIKEYLADTCIAKPAICAMVTHNLDNSVSNQVDDFFTPIDRGINLDVLSEYTNAHEISTLLARLDQCAHYNGAARYTKEEAALRRELDCAYKQLSKVNQSLEFANQDKVVRENKIKSIINGIKHYCSDVGFYQILCSAHMWQAPNGTDYSQLESDRSIRQKYEQMRKSVEDGDSEFDDDHSCMFEITEDLNGEHKKR